MTNPTPTLRALADRLLDTANVFRQRPHILAGASEALIELLEEAAQALEQSAHASLVREMEEVMHALRCDLDNERDRRVAAQEAIMLKWEPLVQEMEPYLQHKSECSVRQCATCGHGKARHLNRNHDPMCLSPVGCDCTRFTARPCSCGLATLLRRSLVASQEIPKREKMIQIGNATDDKVKVTLTGKAEEVIGALASGLATEDLRALGEAIAEEAKRRTETRV